MPHAPQPSINAFSGIANAARPSRGRIRMLGLVLAAGGALFSGMGGALAQSASPSTSQAPNVTGADVPSPPSASGEETNGAFGAAGNDVDGRENSPESAVERGSGNRDDGEAGGIRLGSFILKPSITQSIKTQKTTGSNSQNKRNFLETSSEGTLTSDWSRHELNIRGEGRWQKNLSGNLSTDPGALLDANLRLDLSDDTKLNITGGYELGREDNSDPNAVTGATTQSNVQTLRGGISAERDLGRLRGLVGVDMARTTYSDAKFANGTTLDLSDRDNNAYTLRGRIGYEVSPALIPFVEASIGTTLYDQERDRGGYRRSSDSYALRGGIEADLGEKLRGELGIGYESVTYDDTRLTGINALSLEGSATWSPQRGTNLTTGLQTSVEDSTAPGESGAVLYRLSSELTHELRDNLVAKLSGATTWRRYPSGSLIANSTTHEVGAGLTYRINRYLELEGTVDYEWSRQTGNNTTDLTTGIGLTLRR